MRPIRTVLIILRVRILQLLARHQPAHTSRVVHIDVYKISTECGAAFV